MTDTTIADVRTAAGVVRRIADSGVREAASALTTLTARSTHPVKAPLTSFDPLDRDVIADPFPAYKAMHSSGPVHYSRKRGLWIINGHNELRTACRAHDALSSAEGILRLRSQLPMMLTIDQPDHTRLRKLAVKDFNPQALAKLEPEIDRYARELVTNAAGFPADDLIGRVAAPLPLWVTARLLGVPDSDMHDFRRWSDGALQGMAVEWNPKSLLRAGRMIGSVTALHRYFHDQFELRRQNPGTDLLSKLIASTEDGSLSDDELFWFALLLLIAGHETTTTLLGTLLLQFSEHPDQYQQLRDDPALASGAVDEALRFFAPIQGYYRTAIRDYPIGDVTIPAGARVLMLFGAANRDPRRYEDPDTFRIDRDASDHIAFGFGIHFCLGAQLARMEARLFLTHLADQVAAITVTGQPRWDGNPALRRLERLPARLEKSA